MGSCCSSPQKHIASVVPILANPTPPTTVQDPTSAFVPVGIFTPRLMLVTSVDSETVQRRLRKQIMYPAANHRITIHDLHKETTAPKPSETQMPNDNLRLTEEVIKKLSSTPKSPEISWALQSKNEQYILQKISLTAKSVESTSQSLARRHSCRPSDFRGRDSFWDACQPAANPKPRQPILEKQLSADSRPLPSEGGTPRSKFAKSTNEELNKLPVVATSLARNSLTPMSPELAKRTYAMSKDSRSTSDYSSELCSQQNLLISRFGIKDVAGLKPNQAPMETKVQTWSQIPETPTLTPTAVDHPASTQPQPNQPPINAEDPSLLHIPLQLELSSSSSQPKLQHKHSSSRLLDPEQPTDHQNQHLGHHSRYPTLSLESPDRENPPQEQQQNEQQEQKDGSQTPRFSAQIGSFGSIRSFGC